MIEGQEGLTWDRWLRIADRVEALGLDSLWRSDHFFSVMGRSERPSLETWVSLAALAARTTTLRFGPLVSSMTFRHPALLARMAAAVDLLSKGRLVVGVGAGWNEAEHQAYGITLPPMKERMDRLEEGIQLMRALWRGGPVDFDGHYYRLAGATAFPRPAQRPSPPLLIGGDGEVRLLRIVAQHADEWNSSADGLDVYKAKRSRLEEHCRAVGRNPDEIRRSWMTGVLIGRDPRDMEEKAGWLKAFLPGFDDLPLERIGMELLRRHWVVGMPEEVAGQLDRWSSLGVERVMLQFYNFDDLDSLDLLAEVNEVRTPSGT